eukprot:4365872-Pyramimonas_sp.AAC.1
MINWSANGRAEFFYQKYKGHRKKWQLFVGKAPQKHRGPLRRRHSYESVHLSDFMGVSDGKGRKGDPVGADGQSLKCSTCGSTQHLWRRRPNGRGKGGKRKRQG